MKYYLVLFANCLLILFIIMFFADNKFIPAGTFPKIRNLVLIFLFFAIGYNFVSIYILKRSVPESGIVYRTAASVKKGAGNFAAYSKPFQKELVIYSLIAAGIIVISLLLVGIPGAFLLQLPVKLGICSAITGDGAWPAAILLSILWPLCLPTSIFLKNWMATHGYASFSAVAPLLLTVAGIPLLTALVYAMSK